MIRGYRGWFREGWRHSLAAKGIKSRYAYAGRGPLISNAEIRKIEAWTGRSIGSLREEELQRSVAQVRSQSQPPRVSMADSPKKEGNKVDWGEPFRGPDEKSDMGREVKEQHIDLKKAELQDLMTMRGVDVDKQADILVHDISPVVQKFRDGKIGQREFDTSLMTTVNVKTPGESDDGRFASDHGEYGALNFIDKAKVSKSW